MKKLLLVGAILVGAVTASRAGVHLNIGIGLPLPRLPLPVVISQAPAYCPPPVVCAPPVCPPRVVVSCPPPVVYCPPQPYYRSGYYSRSYGHGYGNDWRHNDRYDRSHGHGYRR